MAIVERSLVRTSMPGPCSLSGTLPTHLSLTRHYEWCGHLVFSGLQTYKPLSVNRCLS